MPHLFLTNDELDWLETVVGNKACGWMLGHGEFNPCDLNEKIMSLDQNQECRACGKELTSSDPRTKTCSDKCRQIHSRKERKLKAKIEAIEANATARVKAAYAAGPEAVAALHAELGIDS